MENNILKITELTKSYIGKKNALNGLNLEIPRGEIIGLFGENGAGKTTLMKCILGFLPYQGTITLDGESITTKNISKISFATSEHSFFPNLTAEAHRCFYKQHFPDFSDKRFNSLMKFFELSLNKPIKNFSTGQKNQFEVILALSQGADYIFMDEPFAGNDIFNREDFYKVLLGILEPKETVVISTHLIEEVSDFIGRAILIHNGEIVGDKTTEELQDENMNLMSYIKKTYNYHADRVSKALDELTSKEE